MHALYIFFGAYAHLSQEGILQHVANYASPASFCDKCLLCISFVFYMSIIYTSVIIDWRIRVIVWKILIPPYQQFFQFPPIILPRHNILQLLVLY